MIEQEEAVKLANRLLDDSTIDPDGDLQMLSRQLLRWRDRALSNSLTISSMIVESHATAVAKGWWEKDRPFSEGIALIHSELSEALEEWRRHGMDKEAMLYYTWPHMLRSSAPQAADDKPEGIAAELADVLIRIGDWCGRHGIPLEEALRAKMAYNKTREHRHGGKIA